MKPPYSPNIKSREDMSNFEVIDAPAEFTPVKDDSGWDVDF